ncbi:MAG: preprotein translocase subunit SecY [Clostridia bacterium]|nr:preprotein translocase subunit SecY [Clostridia bacterium]
MLQTLKNAWKLPDIRKKILFVLFILLLYRVGTVVPVPFVNSTNFASVFGGTILEYMNTLSGGSLEQATLFALGINPYITASIVIELLTVAIPALERLAKQGEEGRKKINNLTRYATVILAVITAIGYYFLLKNNGMLAASGKTTLGAVTIVISYCAGAALVMWLAEKINENGLGNGISLILFANIISSVPSKLIRLVDLCAVGFRAGSSTVKFGIIAIVFAIVLVAFVLAMMVFCVFVTGSERRIPVQYAKRVVGRKMYGGQNSNLPIKLNMSGVMPVIFASSIISLPATIMALCSVKAQPSYAECSTFWEKFYLFMGSDGWFYPVLMFILIIAFSYFYIQISFNPVEVSNNLKQNGGTIVGVRPGRPTAQYIQKILSKVTLMGAFFLSIVAILPIILVPLGLEPAVTGILSGVYGSLLGQYHASYYVSSFTYGGTSLLIVVGVALETVRDLESQLSMRNYKGFLG